MLKQKLEYLDKRNCSFIGTILKHHGFKGQLFVKSDFDFIETQEEPVFIEIDNYLVPFFVNTNSVKYLSENTAIIKFLDIDSEIDAQKLIGKQLFFPSILIIDNEDEENSYSYLTGFNLIDNLTGEIGEIEDFIDIPNNPLFQLTYNRKEILIPVNSLTSMKIDKQNKTVTANLPDGLLSL